LLFFDKHLFFAAIGRRRSRRSAARRPRRRAFQLVIAVMNAASSDWAAARLGVAIERVAEALLVEEEAVPQNGSGIVRANGLVRP
jgi:hypothetical protein